MPDTAAHVASGAGRLGGVVDGLARIGAEHPKCVRCHCYREVAERAVEVGMAFPVAVAAASSLQLLLAGTEAGHG